MFTDHFGQPLSAGDKIAFAVHSGRSSAKLIDATVVELVPLVPHRDYPERLMREDQYAKASPTLFYESPDPTKRFVLKYETKDRRGNPSKRSTDRVTDIVRAP